MYLLDLLLLYTRPVIIVRTYKMEYTKRGRTVGAPSKKILCRLSIKPMIWDKSLNLGTFLAIWGQIVTNQVHRVVTYSANHTNSRCARYVARCAERYHRRYRRY